MTQEGIAALTDDLRALSIRRRSLSIFRSVLVDDIGHEFDEVLYYLVEHDERGQRDGLKAINHFSRGCAYLLDQAVSLTEPMVGDPWQNHLLDRLLSETNLISQILSLQIIIYLIITQPHP